MVSFQSRFVVHMSSSAKCGNAGLIFDFDPRAGSREARIERPSLSDQKLVEISAGVRAARPRPAAPVAPGWRAPVKGDAVRGLQTERRRAEPRPIGSASPARL
jgi:hypothetical protein